MNWIKGWPIAYIGVTALSGGMAIHDSVGVGLITGGVVLIAFGIMQVCKS